MQGLIGKKIGMTQIWDKDGVRVPVTVVVAGPCPVVQVKTTEKDGYEAVQLGWGTQKAARLSKAEVGHTKAAGVEPVRVLREFKADKADEVAPGKVFTVDVFKDTQYVDVVGTSVGRGFMGVVARWGFGGGQHTHGGHVKRRPCSIGMRQTPGEVNRGHKMGGDTGDRRVTVQNLKLISVRPEQNLLLIRGSVPGANGSLVLIRKAVKKAGK